MAFPTEDSMPGENVPANSELHSPSAAPTDSMPGEIVPADSELPSPPTAPSPPLELTEAAEEIASPMTSVANARVSASINQCGSIGNDAGVKVPARNLKPGGVTEAGWVLGAESWPAQSESFPGSFVRPSLLDSAKELSTSPWCGGGASSSSLSNNPPRAPARAPISPEAPPLPDHQRSHRLAPPSHKAAIHHRGNTYSGQLRGNQSWGAPNGHYGNQHHDERGSYGWHNPQGPGHNLYTGMPLPRLPGMQGQSFIPPPTSPWVPYVYAPSRAQAQPPVSLMGYNGVVPAYNDQFVPHFDTYPRVALDTYRMPFNNFQRSPPPVAHSTIRIRSPVDNQQLSLKGQIEYYFSEDNLCKDIFLRSKMDDQGWVPISLIATFNMVKRVTTNTTEILNALRGSTELDIQAEKIRRSADWMRWLLPSTQIPNRHGSSTPQLASNHDDSIIHRMQTHGFEDSSNSQQDRDI